MSLPQPAQAHLPADNRDVQDSQPQRQQPMIMGQYSYLQTISNTLGD